MAGYILNLLRTSNLNAMSRHNLIELRLDVGMGLLFSSMTPEYFINRQLETTIKAQTRHFQK